MIVSRVILLTTLLTFGAATAQERKVDSLVTVLRSTPDDQQKIKLLHRIVSSTWDFSFERAFLYAQQELELANKINDAEGKTIAYTDLGMYYYFIGDYTHASEQYQMALQWAGNKDFGEFPAYTLTRIGNLYRVQGEYDSALYYYIKTEALLKGKPDGIALASVYFHRGWLLQELSKFRESLNFLYRARNIRYRIGDSLLIAECWRVMAISQLGLSNMDSARYYLQKTLRIAERFGDAELVILTNINLGDYFHTQGETVAAIRAYETAMDSLTRHDFKRYQALALFQIGKVFSSRSDYLKAIDFYYQSLKLNEALNCRQEIAQIHGYIGWSQNSLRNFVQAKEQGNLCLTMMRQIKDQAGVSLAFNLLGNIAYNQNDFLLAKDYLDSALLLRKQLGLYSLISNTKFNLAKTYEKLNRYDEALAIYFDELKTTRALQNFYILALCHNNIGSLYTRKHDFVNAEKYLTEGSKLLKRYGQPMDLRDNYYNLARMYKLSGKTQKAMQYYEKYIIANDSLLLRENAWAAQQRDGLYQLEKKNQEIQTLNDRNRLREQEIESHKARIYFQNVILALIFLALVLISITAFVLFRFNRSKSKTNEELYKLNRSILEQKEEIQAQTEELTEANQTISEINRGLEVSVEERTRQLKQAFNELDTFIYRSSHDLRRPLTTFMGLAEVARISVKDNTAIELFDRVNETAHNLDRMLAKLQSVSQIGSTELVAHEITVDLELDYIFDQYRDSIMEKHIRIDRQVKIKKLFRSYPSLVRIILENLVENAINFSIPENAFIIIMIKEEGNGIKIKVEDNGEGIKEEFQNRIFEMYFRANERSRGNGLGLYLVKKAVEKLNGNVLFAPRSPQGSAFTVTFPHLES